MLGTIRAYAGLVRVMGLVFKGRQEEGESCICWLFVMCSPDWDRRWVLMYPVLLFCESGFLCVALAVVHSGLRDPPASLCVPPLRA